MRNHNKSPNQINKYSDSISYQKKKAFFDSLLTIYGRYTCLEAMQDRSLEIHRLHLAKSNRVSGIIEKLIGLAKDRAIEICYHTRHELSRISRNSNQDQGVACDVKHANFRHYSNSFKKLSLATQPVIMALDGVSNPQNLGMIIRSVTASRVNSILLPLRSWKHISPLTIKASAGTLFKSEILRCEDLAFAIRDFKKNGFKVAIMESNAKKSIDGFKIPGPVIFVLGNETNGVSKEVAGLADYRLSIALQRGVQSLNVAVSAALVAFTMT